MSQPMLCLRQVAILCNHQRSVPKGHAGQMDKLKDKTLGLQQELHELQDELAAARRSRGSPKKNPETCATLCRCNSRQSLPVCAVACLPSCNNDMPVP